MGHKLVTGLRRLTAAALLAAVAWGLGTPDGNAQALAVLPMADPLPLGGRDNRPTTAWKEFCTRLPVECRVDLNEPAVVELTPAIWGLLVKVNEDVNTAIIPITDRKHLGVEDRWDYPDNGMGDCEDIQLLKRKLLAEAGLPRRAMRMTVVIDRHDAGHAVLTVRTNRGDFILDNESDLVLPWNKTGYEFVKREGSDGENWVALGGATGRTVVASRSARRR
jgi:predicted transglutaminase-like cysteine proteinase